MGCAQNSGGIPSGRAIADGADVGPLITCQAKERVERLVASGVKEGATLLLGRKVSILHPISYTDLGRVQM